MSHVSCVTSWETWRAAMGRRGSRQRRAVEAFLQGHPAIMYWGDSWFTTPLYLNLARQSCARINGMAITVGRPGGRAAELFSDAATRRMVDRLLASPFDVLCLSAGGNDCLGDPLARVFRAWRDEPATPRISPEQAYGVFVRSGIFDQVFEAYDHLLGALATVTAARPGFRVLGHAYVPIQRIGVPANLTLANIGLVAWLKGELGPWLWTPMQHVLDGGEDAGKAFADLLLVEGFQHRVLDRLLSRYPELFAVADFSAVSGAVEDYFWHDEIHPSEEGFAELAMAFNHTLRKQLPASKQAAVA